MRRWTLFFGITEQLVKKILAANRQLKLEQLWYTQDVSGRQGFRWLNVILLLPDSGYHRMKGSFQVENKR